MLFRSMKDYKSLQFRPPLKKCKVELHAYNNEELQVAGICRTSVKCGKEKHTVRFMVIPEDDRQSLLGLQTSVKLGLINKNDRVQVINVVKHTNDHNAKQNNDSPNKLTESNIHREYKDLFEGLGSLPGGI